MAALAEQMTVDQFVSWTADTDDRWELVDGEPRPIAPNSVTHAALHSTLSRLLETHLIGRNSPFRTLIAIGIVPRVRANLNFRVPDVTVTDVPDKPEQIVAEEPVAIVEILSPGSERDTWKNIWAYTTIPSLREIMVVHSVHVRAELLRRGRDGNWPANPEQIGSGGQLRLESVDFACALDAVYARTHLAGAR